MSQITDVNSLRDFLAQELEKVSRGETTPASANAAANLCGKILGSIKMELEYNKMVGATPHISFIKTLNRNESKKIETDK